MERVFPLPNSAAPTFRSAIIGEAADKALADGALLAIRSAMDEYALELFDLWFSGSAGAEVVFDNAKWAAYMQANKDLDRQIDRHMLRFAAIKRDEFVKSRQGGIGFISQPYKTRFHAEVGGSKGDFWTGYGLLHGSNSRVGDFEISGRMALLPTGGDGFTATFTQNNLCFNDVVDPNLRYKDDEVFANMMRNFAKIRGSAQPKDYILRIRWRDLDAWIYDVPVAMSGGGWLNTFTNKA